jgi:chaperonin GroEL
VFDASSGTALNNISIEDFGTCSKVVIGRNFATFIGDGNEEIKTLTNEKVDQLRKILANDKSLDELRRSNIKKRLAKLAGGIAIVKVGGSTEIEILEKKDRVEDALNATIAAVQEGILPGGGVALYHASKMLEPVLNNLNKKLTENELAGVKVILETCKEPLRVIVENTGKSPDVVINQLETIGETSKNCIREGYDAYKHEYCDLIDAGILDPLKVSRAAMQHANSVIGLLLTCNAVIVNETDEN